MRTWGVATIILNAAAAAHPLRHRQESQQYNATEWRTQVVLNGGEEVEMADQEEEDQCVHAVAMVLLQRIKLLRLWGSLVSIPTLESKTQTQVNALVPQSLVYLHYSRAGSNYVARNSHSQPKLIEAF